jgi:hypothetical protein
MPSRIIGKGGGDNWVGLVDATCGILLTLLVIELPAIILKSIEENKSRAHSPVALASATGVVVIGYFAIFTVVYGIGSYCKTLLLDAKKLRLAALSTGWILLRAGHHRILLLYARNFGFVLIGLLCFPLAVLANSERWQGGQASEG